MRDGEASGGGGSGDGAERDDPGRQRRVNLAVLVFLIFLVAGCVWLAQVLARNARMEDCLMSGRTNCNPIDTSTLSH